MAVYREAISGDVIRVSLFVPPGKTGLYPQATVRDSASDTLTATVNLSGVSGEAGLYTGNWDTASVTIGEYNVVLKVYTDSFGGTLSTVDKGDSEVINLNNPRSSYGISGGVQGFFPEDQDALIKRLMDWEMSDRRSYQSHIEAIAGFDPENIELKLPFTLKDIEQLINKKELSTEKIQKIFEDRIDSVEEKVVDTIVLQSNGVKNEVKKNIKLIEFPSIKQMINRIDFLSNLLSKQENKKDRELGNLITTKINSLSDLLSKQGNKQDKALSGLITTKMGGLQTDLKNNSTKNVELILRAHFDELKNLSNTAIKRLGILQKENKTSNSQLLSLLKATPSKEDINTIVKQWTSRMLNNIEVLEKMLEVLNKEERERNIRVITQIKALLMDISRDFKSSAIVNKEDMNGAIEQWASYIMNNMATLENK